MNLQFLWITATILSLFACQENPKTIVTQDQQLQDQQLQDQQLQDQQLQDQQLQDQQLQDQSLSAMEEIIIWHQNRITSEGSAENFQNITANLNWGNQELEQAILIMDLESTCFPFEKWRDDPPPMGQNWPPLCDAFDRNYEVTLHSPAQTDQNNNQDIAIELMRAITPFGGPLHLEIDITDILNGLKTPMLIKTHITTYADGSGQVSGSNGGWAISGKLKIKRGTAPRKVLSVIPLYNDWYPQQLNRESKIFNLPAGTQKAVIEYRATGHGGAMDPSSSCIGPAEEFCKRIHEISVDQNAEQWLAWRDNCDLGCNLMTSNAFSQPIQYCDQNPMGDINSVKAPRANWCPGSLTPPKIIEIPMTDDLSHTFAFKINQAYEERGWRISAVVIAYAEVY